MKADGIARSASPHFRTSTRGTRLAKPWLALLLALFLGSLTALAQTEGTAGTASDFSAAATPTITSVALAPGGLEGTAATFNVRASADAVEVAYSDGPTTLAEIEEFGLWEPIFLEEGQTTFQIFMELLPYAGSHTIYVIVRNADGIPSAFKTTTVNLAGPAITSVAIVPGSLVGQEATIEVKTSSALMDILAADGAVTIRQMIEFWPSVGFDPINATTYRAPIFLDPYSGSHTISVAIADEMGIISPIKTVSVSLAGPSISSATLVPGSLDGLFADFLVKTSATIMDIFVFDGPTTQQQMLMDMPSWPFEETAAGTFQVTGFELLPFAGAHTVSIAVMNEDGILSPIKTVSVTVVGPSVTTVALAPNGLDGLNATFNITATGDLAEFAIVDGATTLAQIDELGLWQPVPLAAATFQGTVELLPTVGTHTISVAVKDTLGIASAIKTTTVKLAAPVIKTAALAPGGLDGITATFNVTTDVGVNQYAIADGALDLEEAEWFDIAEVGAAETLTSFQAMVDLEPRVGAHTVRIAVRHSDVGIPSAIKTVNVTLAGPTVKTFTLKTQDSIYCQFSLGYDGATHYAVMEGPWNADNADWVEILPAATGTLLFDFEVGAALGPHPVNVALKNDAVGGIVSAPKAVTVRVAAPSIKTATLAPPVNGLGATFNVTTDQGVNQYAIFDGVLDVNDAAWQDIDILTAAEPTTKAFQATVELLPVVGTHKVQLAVRRASVGIPSTVKTITVPIAGPSVKTLKLKSQDSIYCVFTLNYVGATHYAVMEGAWNVENADWVEILPAATGALDFEFAVEATIGAHPVTVAVKSDDMGGIVSKPVTTTARVTAPAIRTATLAPPIAGLDATFNVATDQGVDEYAIVDGILDLGTAAWLPIGLDVVDATTKAFQATVELLPVVGTHKVQLAVRRSSVGIPSAIKTITVPLSGPSVKTLKLKSQDSIYCVFTLDYVSATHYAVMEGAWNVDNAEWIEILPAATGALDFEFAVEATIGAHPVTVAVKSDDIGGIVSKPVTTTARVAAPAIRTATLAPPIAGLDATFNVATDQGVNQFAIIDGVLDVNEAEWQDLEILTATEPTTKAFQATVALLPVVGSHKVQLAVRRWSVGIPSAVKTITVTLTGPTVKTFTKTAQSGIDCTFKLDYDGATHYAVMEGAWDADAADWIEILPAATGSLTFDFSVAPTVGAHTVSAAVKSDDVGGIVSVPKTVSVTVTGPTIASLAPATGTYLTEVTINGSNFGDDQGTVWFDGDVMADVVSWTNTKIVCVAPLLDAGGSIQVAVETAALLRSAGKPFTYKAPWEGSWTGSVMDMSEFDGAAGPGYYGYAIVKLAPRPDGDVNITIPGQPNLVGETMNVGEFGFEIFASGLRTDGRQVEVMLFYDPAFDSIMGHMNISPVEPASATFTTLFLELARPEPLGATLNGVMVIYTNDQWATYNPTPANTEPVGIVQFTQSGENLTMLDKVWKETITGLIVGDIFVVVMDDGVISGMVTEIEGTKAIAIAGTYEWYSLPEEDFDDEGWGEFEGMVGQTATGLANGTTNWTLFVESLTTPIVESTEIPAQVTITGNTFKVVILDPEGTRTLNGFIYNTDFGPTFAAVAVTASSEFYIGGWYNGDDEIEGAYEMDEEDSWDEGYFTGFKD